MVDIVEDGLAQMFLAGEVAPPNGFGGKDREPALDLVEPRRVSRREKEAESRMVVEPVVHFVGRVVARGAGRNSQNSNRTALSQESRQADSAAPGFSCHKGIVAGRLQVESVYITGTCSNKR